MDMLVFFGLFIKKRLHARERSRLKDCKQHPALQQALYEGILQRLEV